MSSLRTRQEAEEYLAQIRALATGSEGASTSSAETVERRRLAETTIRILSRDVDRLRNELDLERGKRRAMTGTTWFFGAIAVVLGMMINRWVVFAWVAVLIFGYAALIVGTSLWAAKRGDREMGIGDTQGRGHDC